MLLANTVKALLSPRGLIYFFSRRGGLKREGAYYREGACYMMSYKCSQYLC